jgi:hypothetical protein
MVPGLNGPVPVRPTDLLLGWLLRMAGLSAETLIPVTNREAVMSKRTLLASRGPGPDWTV